MNHRIARILSVIFLILLLFGFRDKGVLGNKDFRYEIIESLPSYYEGRMQPLSSVARSALARIHGDADLLDDDKTSLKPIEWICRTAFDLPERSDSIPVFKISNDEIRTFVLHRRDFSQRTGWKKLLLGEHEDASLYTYEEISAQFPRIERQAAQARSKRPGERTAFQKAILELARSIEIYRGIYGSARLDEMPFAEEIERLESLAPAGKAALESRNSGGLYDHDSFDRMMGKWYVYDTLKQEASISLIPEVENGEVVSWKKFASVIDAIAENGRADEFFEYYAALGDSYRANDSKSFNQAALNLKALYEMEAPAVYDASSFEHQYRSWRLLYSAFSCFVLSLIIVFVYWMRKKQEILTFSYWLSAGGLAVLTAELACRSKIAGIAPIFGFYASSILLAWWAIIIGLALQRKYWNGLSLFAANSIASIFLAIAISTSLKEPTIKILPIDLASNGLTFGFVSFLTIGYASSLLAGAMGLLYFPIAIFTNRMNRETDDRFGTISYRLISMSTGFAVAGALFGSLWAQDASGRFWTWTPKETSTLLVIVWNTIMLHAHWGGFTKTRSFLAMAIAGNLLCAFSLLGVDLFAIGSQPYEIGTRSPFFLIAFSSINILGLFIAAIPRSLWRSDSSI